MVSEVFDLEKQVRYDEVECYTVALYPMAAKSGDFDFGLHGLWEFWEIGGILPFKILKKIALGYYKIDRE